MDGLHLQPLLNSAQEKEEKMITVTLLEAMAARCKHSPVSHLSQYLLKADLTTFRVFGVKVLSSVHTLYPALGLTYRG